MKKLVYEIVTLALSISLVSNTFATVAKASSGIGGENKNEGIIYNVSEEEVAKLLSDRFANPNKYKDAEIKLLGLKKTALAESISKGIAEMSAAPLEVKNEAKKTPGLHGVVIEPKSGVEVEIYETPKNQLVHVNPKNIGRYLGDNIIDGEYTVVDDGQPKKKNRNGKASFSHLGAFAHSTKEAFGPYGKHFAVEAFTFYLGVGANHFFNLLKSYENNPVALEQFIEELQDPVAQAGFFAFMVGNRYAMSYFNFLIQKHAFDKGVAAGANAYAIRQHAFEIQSKWGPKLSFVAMAAGSILSNVTHDVITLTKPCATALTNKDDPKYDTPQERSNKCMEGWNAVMHSDSLARYVTATVSVSMAAAASSGLQWAYKQALINTVATNGARTLTKKLPFHGYHVLVSRSLKLGRMVPGPVGWGLRIFDLVLFLQTDEIINPHVHYAIENIMNSNANLARDLGTSSLFVNRLEANKWSDVTDLACKQSIEANARNRRDHIPKWIQDDMRICTSGLESITTLSEKNKKWRDAITYEFMNAYYNWLRFISEFQVMHDVSKTFYQGLIDNTYDMKSNKVSGIYNPMTTDYPFYGINLSEKVEVNQLFFSSVLEAQAQRIIETIPVLDVVIKRVQNHLNKWNAQNSKPQIVYGNPKSVAQSPMRSAYLDVLIKAKKDFEEFKRDPKPENYSKLVPSLKSLGKALSASQQGLAQAAQMAQLSGPYASTISQGQKRAISYGESEALMRKKTSEVIKNFLGEPKPLVKGEAFFEIFNDYVKNEKSEYVKLFDEKRTAADTMVWYAVCGNNLIKGDKKSAIDQRRAPIVTLVDDAVNPMIAAKNNATKTLTEFLNIPNIFEQKPDVLRSVAEFFGYGTGVDFYAPKVVDQDISQICASSKYSIRPNPKGKAFVVGGKTYTSLYSYLINNLRADVVNVQRDGENESVGFNLWWKENIDPGMERAYAKFDYSYQKLIQKKYREAIDSGIGRNDTSILPVIKGSRALYGNGKNLVQSYNDEASNYLTTLYRLYKTAPERLEKASYDKSPGKGFSAKKQADELALFHKKAHNIRSIIFSLLNDLRHLNSSKGENEVKGSKDGNILAELRGASLQKKYALLLYEMGQINSLLGMDHQVIALAAKKTTYFRNKFMNRKPHEDIQVDMTTSADKLLFRTGNDASLTPIWEQLYEKYPLTEYKMLSYGLGDEFNVEIDATEDDEGNRNLGNVTLHKNYKDNDRLALAFFTTNQLFSMAEDLFMRISILNAAKSDNTYQDLDTKETKSGSGSRRF